MSILYIGNRTQNIHMSLPNANESLVFASNCLEALKMLKSQGEIDVIICEYNLPGNNGIYFYNQLKDSRQLSKLPFI